MKISEAIELFRRTTRDTKRPYLWSDEEIVEFFSDAQDQAARRAHLLIASSGDLAEASVSAGDPMVELDPRVIHIRRARLASNNMPLRKMMVRDMDERVPGWEGSTAQTTPSVYLTDYQTDMVRLYGVPRIADTLMMTVVYAPLPLDPNASEGEFEINARYHRGLLDWALFRGYARPGAITYDPARAEKHEADFVAEFGERATAIDEAWSMQNYADQGEV